MISTVTRLARPSVTQRIFAQVTAARTFVSPTIPLAADLPYHIVVGMPALSPTMDAGALAEWYVGEGDSFGAGDAVAKIETDKASIDFEAQDDAVIARLLVPAGDGKDIPVGTPIMITVEEEADVAAFKDYVHVADEPEPPAAAPAEPVAVAAVPEPVAAAPAPAPVAAAPAAVAPTPVAAVAPATPTAAAGISTAWGLNAQTASPLAKTLSKEQSLYLKKFGSTGQLPL